MTLSATFGRSPIRNVHERHLPVPASALEPLLRGLAGPHDPLWPAENIEPMRFDRQITEGAVGGHGPVHYRVDEFSPPDLVRFTFLDGAGLVGEHRYETRPGDDPNGDDVVFAHILEARPVGAMRLAWPLVVRWLHDETIEASLDRAHLATTGLVPKRRRPRWTRLLLRLAPASLHAKAAAERAERDSAVPA